MLKPMYGLLRVKSCSRASAAPLNARGGGGFGGGQFGAMKIACHGLVLQSSTSASLSRVSGSYCSVRVLSDYAMH